MLPAKLQAPEFGKETQFFAAFEATAHLLQLGGLALLLFQQTLQLKPIRIDVLPIDRLFAHDLLIGLRLGRLIMIGRPLRCLLLRGLGAWARRLGGGRSIFLRTAGATIISALRILVWRVGLCHGWRNRRGGRLGGPTWC